MNPFQALFSCFDAGQGTSTPAKEEFQGVPGPSGREEVKGSTVLG